MPAIDFVEAVQEGAASRTYPRRDAGPAFSPEAFGRLTATLFSWRQAPGAFGGLHLHSCWGEASVLSRRYHGQTAATARFAMGGFLRLHAATGEERWADEAADLARNLLFLQAPEGGFAHASGEFEPTYTCAESCPIHQGMPLLALLEYAGWEGAEPRLRGRIRPATDLHWEWLQRNWWRRGNAWSGLLRSGWCGVTNQDLTIVAVLAEYGRVYGDWGRYERFGLPVLGECLGPGRYYPEVGLFERGDKPRFTERTAYAEVILEMLEVVHAATGDLRIPEVIGNVAAHLGSAAFVGDDGLVHLAWGATLEGGEGRRRVAEWIRSPRVTSAYPTLIRILRGLPSPEAGELAGSLEATLAAWTFGDGVAPAALGEANPLLAVAPTSAAWRLWHAHAALGRGRVPRSATFPAAPVVWRRLGDLRWRGGPRAWAVERGGERLYAGIKADPSALRIGPGERLPLALEEELDRPDLVEEVVP